MRDKQQNSVVAAAMQSSIYGCGVNKVPIEWWPTSTKRKTGEVLQLLVSERVGNTTQRT